MERHDSAILARNYVVAVNIGPLVALAGTVRALVEETKNPKKRGKLDIRREHPRRRIEIKFCMRV